MTPLHKAMRPTLCSVEEEVEVVRLLIDAGAKVDAVSYTQATPGTLVDGYTPLHCAAVHGDCAMARMRLLVQHGADVNALTPLLRGTALHMAACLGREKAVSLLLVELGADANIKCKSGNTARDLASENGFHSIVKTLDEHLVGAFGAMPLRSTQSIDSIQSFQSLLEHDLAKKATSPRIPRRPRSPACAVSRAVSSCS
jgi:ankyrin repeat protein